MGEVNSVKSKCFHPNVRYPLVHILSQDHTYWRPQNDLFWSFIEIKPFSTPSPFPFRTFLGEKSRRKWLSELTRSNLGNDFGQFFFILDNILSWKENHFDLRLFFLKRSLWPHFFIESILSWKENPFFLSLKCFFLKITLFCTIFSRSSLWLWQVLFNCNRNNW